MTESAENPVIFSGEAVCRHLDGGGNILREGKVQVTLTAGHFSLLKKDGWSLSFPYREILEVECGDYKSQLHLITHDVLEIERLGYNYEDFLRLLFKLRGEMLIVDMLMHEKVKEHGFAAQYTFYNEEGTLTGQGPCEPRLYQTALIIIPEMADPLRLPYSDISAINEEDYTVAVETEYGEKLLLSKMGYQRDGFKVALARAVGELKAKAAEMVRELLPAANPLQVEQIAHLMREGRAALQSEIEGISSGLWEQLAATVEQSSAGDEYKYLISLSGQNQAAIGVKRGLLGELTGDYTWFLIPLYSADPTRPGNAIALEAFSEQQGARATYFFRIYSRGTYAAKAVDSAAMREDVNRLLRRISRSMMAINFRREPIYLPAERLYEPRYRRYLYALHRLSALQELRSLFIGRVMHKSPEQWCNDVTELLKFNISGTDDTARWRKDLTVAGDEELE